MGIFRGYETMKYVIDKIDMLNRETCYFILFIIYIYIYICVCVCVCVCVKQNVTEYKYKIFLNSKIITNFSNWKIILKTKIF